MIYQGRIPTPIKLLVVIVAFFTAYLIFNGGPTEIDPIDDINNLYPNPKAIPDTSPPQPKHHTNFRPVDKGFLAKMDKQTLKCPDYVEYSKQAHPPYSLPDFHYPYMRPAPKCRTFTSSAVEKLIVDLTSKVKNADLARLIENCLPNTLDTTILYHNTEKPEQPQSFVVTGDIHAEWLRDAARQLSVYQPLIKYDPKLQQLILGAINTQAYYISNSPYCNAFHPPPKSGVKKGSTAMDDVHPRPDWKQVFECKYEIDSLASFLTLSNEYFQHAPLEDKTKFLNREWLAAFEKLLVVIQREIQPSFDKETGQALPFYYSFQRHTNIGSETLPLGGVGNPVNFDVGLVRSAFRPSDDATVLQFFIPGNAHMVTELIRARKMYLNKDMIDGLDRITDVVDKFIHSISKGIKEYGIVNHAKYGKVYAYEVDGYGSALFMDDANIPSLLSLPDMGFTSIDDPVYQNTRKMLLEKSGNPYYLTGQYFQGIGGPHIGIRNAWPMSLLVRIRTTENDQEILKSLRLVMETTAGLGLMHETVDVNSQGGRHYTRSWFAWCNSEFGKTILHLAKHKPHLIFKPEFSESYDLEKVLGSS
ncbi:Meiotically up-regulated protein [Spathaspora sp. JA1]|nr:Meiotically up-regulated protein [Spathaspora sp. JA1]